MNVQEFIGGQIAENAASYTALSHQIWEWAELPYQEKQSAKALAQALRREGFAVEEGVASLHTAFVAEAGHGGPVIAFLGEYDALPGLSQQADVAFRSPLEEGRPGHGCGHHLLGVGALAAAVAVKRYLEAAGRPGRVRYYGCPAEEGGAGKVHMALAGLFGDVDAALTWHPSTYNNIWSCNFLATRTLTFRFSGFSAHSTMQPQLGRSALEAVELTSVGANYLRGHLERDVFLNGAVQDAGGTAPNIIPDRAAVTYLIRAPGQEKVRSASRRLCEVARGAAMMSGTTVEITVDSGLSEMVPNRALERLLHKNFVLAGISPPLQEDLDFAHEIRRTLPEGAEETTFSNLRYLYGQVAEEIIPQVRGKDIEDIIYPYLPIPHPKFGSTDVCDVSWFTPTAQLTTACYAKDTPGHSWQYVAQGKRRLAADGMLAAGRAMALTGVALLTDPAALEQVRAEFAQAVKGRSYVNPLTE